MISERWATSTSALKKKSEDTYIDIYLVERMDSSLQLYVFILNNKGCISLWFSSLNFGHPWLTIYSELNTRIQIVGSDIIALDSLGMKNNSDKELLIEIYLLKSHGQYVVDYK